MVEHSPAGRRVTWHLALQGISLLLVDFDGPLVRLLPDPEHHQAAQRMLSWYRDTGRRDLDIPALDHVAVLRRIRQLSPDLAADAAKLADEIEFAASARRQAYPQAVAVLRAWLDEGGHVAVVSNNAQAAVQRVLARTTLRGELEASRVVTVHARTRDNVERLKPQPNLLCDALRQHGVAPASAVMVGDTTSDMLAAAAAGVSAVGVADSATRESELHGAGAQLVVRTLAELR